MRVARKNQLNGVSGFAYSVMLGFLLTSPLLAQVPSESLRISFQIATGPVSGSYLPAGEAIAFIISHPPGLTRCDVKGVCGPTGLIATTRSSSGSVSNALSVDSGNVQSAIVQGDIAAAAAAGTGPFEDSGPLKNVQAMARLHSEALHFVLAAHSGIKRLKDLAGKRVAIDSSNSATEFTVRAVLAAAGVATSRIRFKPLPAEKAAEAIRDGHVDAFFMTGVAPLRPVDGLIRRGYARLGGIDTRTLSRLARKSTMYGREVIAAGTYRSLKPVTTLGIASLWVVNRSQSNDTVWRILESLWNKANQPELKRRASFAGRLDVRKATQGLPLPLHEGAQRFYARVQR